MGLLADPSNVQSREGQPLGAFGKEDRILQVPPGSLTEAFLGFMEVAMKKMSRTF